MCVVAHRIAVAGLAAAILAPGAGCDYTWRSKTVQPPLRLDRSTEARTSLPGVILLSDMELPRIRDRQGIARRFKLANSAYFVVVNKDRLRFHVNLVHKWEKIADPARWRVFLEDSHGNNYIPRLENRKVAPVTRHFQVGQNRMGQGVINPYPLLSIVVYRGTSDYVFSSRDIFNDGINSLTLVLERPGYTYRYQWTFAEDAPDVATARVTTEVLPVVTASAPSSSTLTP